MICDKCEALIDEKTQNVGIAAPYLVNLLSKVSIPNSWNNPDANSAEKSFENEKDGMKKLRSNRRIL